MDKKIKTPIHKAFKIFFTDIEEFSFKWDIHIVGGFVRDLLVGIESSDCDFCAKGDVRALCELIKRKTGLNYFVLDDEFSSYRFTQKCAPARGLLKMDFTRMKKDNLDEDLARRDFTINAMAVKLGDRLSIQNLIDHHKGITDLRSKVLRAVSESNLKEDPLRMLRAVRISAELGFEIDKKTGGFIKKNARLISKSAPERIKDEIYKILLCRGSAGAFEEMLKKGLLEELFPEAVACRNLAKVYYSKYGVLTHLLDSLNRTDYILENLKNLFPKYRAQIENYLYEVIPGGNPRYATLKIAAFLHDIGKAPTAKMRKGRLRFFYHEEEGDKMIRNISKRLRLSGKEGSLISLLTLAHMRPGNLAYQKEITEKAKYRFFRDYGDESVAVLLISLADRFTYLTDSQIKSGRDVHHKAINQLLKYYYSKHEKTKTPKLLNGNQIMDTFSLKPGRLVGRILEELNEAQSLGIVKNRGEALKFAQKIIDNSV